MSKNDTRALYACKVMSKARVLERKREKLIMNERNILAKVDHPFIVRARPCPVPLAAAPPSRQRLPCAKVALRYAFQDDESLYLVMDLLSGGELGVAGRCRVRLPRGPQRDTRVRSTTCIG